MKSLKTATTASKNRIASFDTIIRVNTSKRPLQVAFVVNSGIASQGHTAVKGVNGDCSQFINDRISFEEINVMLIIISSDVLAGLSTELFNALASSNLIRKISHVVNAYMVDMVTAKQLKREGINLFNSGVTL